MADSAADNVTPAIYESTPPTWVPQVSSTADLGYPGFHPPFPHQEEDQLSDVHIKGGLQAKYYTPAECFTSKNVLSKTLKEDNVLSDLDDFMNHIFKRRFENLPKIPQASFKPPPRVTLNDAKRNAWFQDLANPDVPLHKLGKSVPHGAKGHDLLELLHKNKVEIPRAVWFLRVFGSNETAGLRNKPNYNPMQYSVDWANVMTGYLRKQLIAIALPRATRPGSSIKQSFKGTLSDADGREDWVARFSYSLNLLHTFYSEGMVDHPTFLSWLVHQMNSCNLAQAGFVGRLVDEYLDGMVSSRALLHPLADACLTKLNEISLSTSKESLLFLQDKLEYILRRTFLAAPDTFVSPIMWMTHAETMRRVFTENVLEGTGNEVHIEKCTQMIRRSMELQLRDVELRNEALMLKSLPNSTSGRLRSAVQDVQLLNSITAGSDLNSVQFFDPYLDSNSPEFIRKIDILLSWCITPYQYGDHRPYAAVTLLWFWREKANARATRRDTDPPDDVLQDHLFDWLDTSELAGDECNRAVVSLLFGELVEKDLFSYAKYIQRVIARGETGLSFSEEPGSRHRNFLRSIPLQKSSPALNNQRKVTLYGVRAREIPEDALEKEIRAEIRRVLPEPFGESTAGVLPLLSALQSSLSTLRSSSRYEQTRVIQHWFRPIIRKYFVSSQNVASKESEVLRTYCVAVEMMGLIRSYRSILETSLDLLAHAPTRECVVAVTETLKRHADIWACLNENGRITHALYASYHVWKSRGVPMQSLLSFVLYMDAGRHLDMSSRHEINTELHHYMQALAPSTGHIESVPAVLPEILLLAQDTSLDAPSGLASSLWYKYRNSYDWAWIVWDNVIASLRQIPLMMGDAASRHACVLRYATFLFHIDQHLPGGLDSHVLHWFLGSGLHEMSALTSEAWGVVLIMLLDLCIHGPLTATTLLQGVVYPGWQLGSTAKTEQQGHSVAVFVQAANQLCQLLLINDDSDSDNIPPTDLLQAQKIRTRRQEVYRELHFSLLVNNLPALVILEHNVFIAESLRLEVKRLRYCICQAKDFRLGTYQNLDAVRAAFEKPLRPETISEALHVPFISAMCLILSDEEINILSSDHPTERKAEGIASLLSPWKLAASAIAMQYLLKQLGQSLASETTREKSDVQLDTFASRFFCHNISSDEAQFVAEMTRSTGAVVAGKFFKHGLQRIADILNQTSSCEADDLDGVVDKTGEILKLLNNIRGPLLTNDLQPLQSMDSSVGNKFVKSILSKLQLLHAHLTSEGPLHWHIRHITKASIFLARLIQFFVLFPGSMLGIEDTGRNLLNTLFEMALVYGGTLNSDPVVFPLLLDTAFFVFDAIGSKPLPNDLFLNCQTLSDTGLPPSMPSQWRDSLSSILKYERRDDATHNLVYASRDSSGQITYSAALQNRPWEWIEYLGENPSTEQKDTRRDPTKKEHVIEERSVRNNASISLELFNARLTGDSLPSGGSEEKTQTRMFEDNLASESMYERDWRESRIFLDELSLSGRDDRDDGPSKTSKTTAAHRDSPGHSPLSRSSAYTVPSRMPSPAVPTKLVGSSREPIDVDAAMAPSIGSKRSAASASLEDDEDLMALDAPTDGSGSNARSKGGRQKTAAKTKTRKK